MPAILHRLSFDAPIDQVQPLIATREGVGRWWTGEPVSGDDTVGGRIAVRFGGRPGPAAVLQVLRRDPDHVAWRCVEGPKDWIGTEISFALHPREGGGTTLLFRHDGWAAENEFMHGCSTNWASYLISLRQGADGAGFAPYPEGEYSRWS